jgi:hypothetical protein
MAHREIKYIWTWERNWSQLCFRKQAAYCSGVVPALEWNVIAASHQASTASTLIPHGYEHLICFKRPDDIRIMGLEWMRASEDELRCNKYMHVDIVSQRLLKWNCPLIPFTQKKNVAGVWDTQSWGDGILAFSVPNHTPSFSFFLSLFLLSIGRVTALHTRSIIPIHPPIISYHYY